MDGQSDKVWRYAVRNSPDFEPREEFVTKTRDRCIAQLKKQEKRKRWLALQYQGIVVAATFLLVWGVSSFEHAGWWSQQAQAPQAEKHDREGKAASGALSAEMQRSLNKLQSHFPILQTYSRISVEDVNEEVKSVVLVKDNGTVATIYFDHEGDVGKFYLSQKRVETQHAIPEDKATAQAARLLDAIVGPSPYPFDVTSVWTERSFDLQMHPTIRAYTINFKATIDAASAYYATVELDSEGAFLSYEKVKKPHSYDSWYKADFNKRIMPKDEHAN